MTRMNYWLTGLITIERVYVTKYPTGQWLKSPKMAKKLIMIIVLVTSISHTHEVIHYNVVADPKYSVNG
ncbi:unnamed protein product, partial [Rotaria sp. Silwood2]